MNWLVALASLGQAVACFLDENRTRNQSLPWAKLKGRQLQGLAVERLLPAFRQGHDHKPLSGYRIYLPLIPRDVGS